MWKNGRFLEFFICIHVFVLCIQLPLPTRTATIFSSHVICSRLLLSERYRKIIEDNNAFKREHKEEYLAKVREGENDGGVRPRRNTI